MIKLDNLDQLLAGEDEYFIWNSNAHMPTDTEQVFNACLKEVDGIAKPLDEFWGALLRLSERKDLAWLAMYYLLEIAFWQRRHNLKILWSEMEQQLAKNLLVSKPDLQKNTSYGSDQYADGMWGEVKRLHSILCGKYGICIFKEDEL
jgi:hypothetical protein